MKTIAGRTPIIVPHDCGFKLSGGPVIIDIIRDANDGRFYLDRDGRWATGPGPFMCDAHSPDQTEKFISAHADPIEPSSITKDEMLEALSWAKEQAVLAIDYPKAAALRDAMVFVRQNWK